MATILSTPSWQAMEDSWNGQWYRFNQVGQLSFVHALSPQMPQPVERSAGLPDRPERYNGDMARLWHCLFSYKPSET